MGHRYLHSARNVRIILYGHFRIAYLVKGDGNVEILGVFHGSLDIAKYQLWMTFNNALERTAKHRRPRLAAAQPSRLAAQLGR
jgi:hypothetical protein